MSESRTTLTLCGAAAAASVVAWILTPNRLPPEAFADRGELFFAEFTDPNTAMSLEVIEFDRQDGIPRAFKVLNRNGRWIIPSQFDYPADAEERLSQIAAAMVTLRKDDFVSDLTAEHERLGVSDPLDVSMAGSAGRGVRISMRGRNERVLADIILGNEARSGYRYARLPSARRVYMTNVGPLDVSTRFEDWIDRDILQVGRDEIDELVLRNYSVEETTDKIDLRETLFLRLRRDGWSLDGLQPGERLSGGVVAELLARLVGLRIVGVFPKPAGITATLARGVAAERVSRQDLEDLARKGFYLTREGGLYSNEGEIIVHTRSGIFYTLRFGQLAPTDTTAARVAEGATPESAGSGADQEDRYLFIMAAHDPSSATGPPRDQEEAATRIRLLQARFAPWYYIISADDFERLRPGRADLVLGR